MVTKEKKVEGAEAKTEKPLPDAETLALVGQELAGKPVGYFTVDALSAILNADWYIVRALLRMTPERFQEVTRGHWVVRDGVA